LKVPGGGKRQSGDGSATRLEEIRSIAGSIVLSARFCLFLFTFEMSKEKPGKRKQMMRCQIDRELPADPKREITTRQTKRAWIYAGLFVLGIAVSLIAASN